MFIIITEKMNLVGQNKNLVNKCGVFSIKNVENIS